MGVRGKGFDHREARRQQAERLREFADMVARSGSQVIGAPDAIEALRDALGGAPQGYPPITGPLTLWGVPVIVSTAVPPGALFAVDMKQLRGPGDPIERDATIQLVRELVSAGMDEGRV